MTKIDIFSGFLGAGKTTLIKKLIAEAYQGEQIVLNTTQLPFNFYRNVDGVWRKRSPWNADFDTVSTWLTNVLKQADLTVNPT